MSTTLTIRPTATMANALEVYLLGVVEFDAVRRLQDRLVYELSGPSAAQGVLILCEHPPLITIGRQGSRSHVAASQHDLDASEIDVCWVARGGGACIHSIGQLSIYPLLPLDTLKLGVAQFRVQIEESLVSTCRDLQVPAKRVESSPGVWSRGGQLAQFGAAIKNGVSCHGATLSVNPDPGFLKLVESSPPGERLTSLQVQRGRPVEMSGVRESVIHHLSTAFGYERVHVYTGHPLLKRTTRKVCLHA